MPLSDSYQPSPSEIEKLETLLKSHKGLEAWHIIKELPDLQTWRGFEGRQVAAKLASALGNRRLGNVIDWFNWRENRSNHQAYFRALFARSQFSTYSLLLPEIEQRLDSVEPDSETYSDLLGLIAACYTNVREFKKAHQTLDQAMQNCKDPSWLWVQRSFAYQKEDRYEDSLKSAEEGKSIKPWYRPVVEMHAQALINLNRDTEARDALIEACKHSDSPAFPLRLSGIYSDLDDTEQTSHWLSEYERKSPLLNQESLQWLAGRRADVCYLSGDIHGFLSYASQTKKKSFHRRCQEFYQENNGANGVRKKLNVQFVRQHNMTCAPATISALTSFFDKPHDHLKIADAICYDGTPWHKERLWCEQHDFTVCEFPVTMESTKALIDSNIPFSLTTQSINSGHLQACIGYDEKLGLIILRDPTHRHYGEVILKSLQDEHPIVGLRGLAFVPNEMKDKLQSLAIPGQRPYDLYHELNCAFDENDEQKIEHVMACFRTELAEHPLRLHSEQRLAARRSHPATELEFTEKLIKYAPKHQYSWLQKIRSLERLSRYTEARDFLSSVHRKPDSDPFFDIEVGELLCRDVRSIEMGQFYLRRALRQDPSNSQAHASYARSLNILGQREDSLRFRRSASKLSRSFEPYARAYYNEAKYLRQGDEALSYLRERAAEAGNQNVEPHITLLNTLASNNDLETPALAEELLKTFPNNGELLLEAVTLFSGWNRHQEAVHYLEQAQEKVSRTTWLRVAARYWSWTGDRAKSRELWEQLIKLQPLNVSAYESVARHLAEENERDSAVQFMRRAHEENPDYLPILKAYIEWEEFNGPSVSIPLLEKAIALDPLDLWAIRELSLEFSQDGQHKEAESKALDALAIDPSDAFSHGILGLAYEAAEKKDDAALAFQKSLQLDIDHLSAFEGLLRVNDSFAERKKALEFVRSEMIRQVSSGEIVSEYRIQAVGVIDEDKLEADLKLFHQERPDLWQTWSALREHYHATSQFELELQTAQKLTEHFPLLPRAWAELAFAQRAQGDRQAEVTAFQKAIELSPSWDWILRELSQCLEALERHDDALDMLERSIQVEPLAPGGYGYKADLLWKIGKRHDAIEEIKRGIRISPLYGWGWTKLIEWTKLENRQDEVSSLITDLEKKRAHQWKWWNCLSDVYEELGDLNKALACIDRGLESKPHNINLLDQKANFLTQVGRYSDAIAVCQTSFEHGTQPVRLQGREAWIMMLSGRRQEAWDRMQKLSENEPDYYFAHSQLASWAFDTQSWDQLKKASTRMVALRPDEDESWGYLGIAEEELNQNTAALAAYTRALRVNPSYVYGARKKAELEIKASHLDEAESTLTKVHYHVPSSFILADLLEIDLKRCSHEINQTMRDRLEQISSISAELEQDPYYYIDTLFKDAKLMTQYELLLYEKSQANAFRSQAEARAWGRRIQVSTKRKKHLKQALQSDLKEPYKASILAEVIRGHSNQINHKEIDTLIGTHSELIKKHYDSWEAALDYYTETLKETLACQYGDLWKNFIPELNPSILAGYTSFVDQIRGSNDGFATRQAILEEFPQWEGTKFIRIGFAFQHAVDGRLDEAEEYSAGYMDGHTPHKFYDLIYHHTLAIIAANRGESEACEKHFRSAAELMRDFPQDKESLRYLHTSAQSCATKLNLHKGNPKKLLKQWAKGLGKEESNIPWWVIAIVIYFSIKMLIALMD